MRYSIVSLPAAACLCYSWCQFSGFIVASLAACFPIEGHVFLFTVFAHAHAIAQVLSHSAPINSIAVNTVIIIVALQLLFFLAGFLARNEMLHIPTLVYNGLL